MIEQAFQDFYFVICHCDIKSTSLLHVQSNLKRYDHASKFIDILEWTSYNQVFHQYINFYSFLFFYLYSYSFTSILLLNSLICRFFHSYKDRTNWIYSFLFFYLSFLFFFSIHWFVDFFILIKIEQNILISILSYSFTSILILLLNSLICRFFHSYKDRTNWTPNLDGVENFPDITITGII
jgi:hypothetical protein